MTDRAEATGKRTEMPPWIAQQAQQLLAQQGHAWLLQGPSGLGQYSLGLLLVRAWLCDAPTPQGACGQCGSCHAVEVHTHADLCVLMPETTLLELGWPLGEKAQDEIDSKKRKASREIRVDAMRDAIEFAQRTSARGRGKAVLVFPAEQMNTITANALLKTLEEPPGDVRFVLATQAAHQLLPTIRSRCQVHTMRWPEESAAAQWLQAQGLPAAEALPLLRLAGGRPDEALAYAQASGGASAWSGFAQAMVRGDVNPVRDWPVAHLIDAQHKLCHDLLALAVGAQARFFDAGMLKLSTRTSIAALTAWAKALSEARKTMDHPFNAGLMQEALVQSAQSALNSTH